MIDWRFFLSGFFGALAVAFMIADFIQNNTILFFTFN